MNCVYEMIETEETDVWGRRYVGYGIVAWQYADGVCTCLHRVPDLFRSRRRCAAFVQMCNEEHVAPFHLPEIIDNLLAQ